MRKIIFKVFLIILTPTLLIAGLFSTDEYATFQTFYQQSTNTGWILAGATILALISGAAVFFSGGTASPLVASIGTWIGNTMGLTGAAATNAGLAFLGGGSLASGGLGMAGGAALLTSALSFSTSTLIDYSIDKIFNAYDYHTLVQNSKKMITLPLPINKTGPKAYEDAMEILENIDNSAIYTYKGQKIINQAIEKLKNEMNKSDLKEYEKLQNTTLLSLLYFLSNDYKKAKFYADFSISLARKLKIKRTLPAFIYATSSLYDKTFDFEKITKNYFRYSVLAEPENPLISLMFSIYLDRMMFRLTDGYLSADSLKDIFNIMQDSSLEDDRVKNYTILLTRYFMLLKLNQQKISSLATTSNETIKNSPKTLEAVRKSLNQYNILLRDAKNIMAKLLSMDLKDEDKKHLIELNELLEKYSNDENRLKNMVNKLENYQAKISQSNWLIWVIIAITILLIYIIWKRKNEKDFRQNKSIESYK